MSVNDIKRIDIQGTKLKLASFLHYINLILNEAFSPKKSNPMVILTCLLLLLLVFGGRSLKEAR